MSRRLGMIQNQQGTYQKIRALVRKCERWDVEIDLAKRFLCTVLLASFDITIFDY